MSRKPFRRKFTAFAVCGSIILAILLAAWFGFGALRYHARRDGCVGNCWRALSLVFVQYYEDHGYYPTNLDALYPEYVPDRGVFECPGVGPISGSAGAGGRIDYIYIDWSTQPHGPDWSQNKYPMLYDRSLANHDDWPFSLIWGRGVNVVLTDCSHFWDRDAAWLKEFAAKHPEARIPLPK